MPLEEDARGHDARGNRYLITLRALGPITVHKSKRTHQFQFPTDTAPPSSILVNLSSIQKTKIEIICKEVEVFAHLVQKAPSVNGRISISYLKHTTMSSPIVYFVTGANRGIGLAVVKELLETKTDIYIFAGARNSSPALTELVSKYSDRLSVVGFVAADETSNKAAARIVGDKFGHVDVVLGVAGIANYMGRADETPASVLNEHLTINVTGILVLFQAFNALLQSSKAPKFIPLTSGVASLTSYISMPLGYTCYGSSKAALNYITRKIHYENEWLTAFPLSPGVIETDMAKSNRAMDTTGTLATIQDAMAVKPEVGAKLLIGIIDSATRETHGGEFINLDGSKITW